MDLKLLATSDVQTQVETLCEVVEASPLLSTVLDRSSRLGLPNWYLGGGSIAQTVWNVISGNDMNTNIKDCDVVYYDPWNTTYEAEDEVIRRGKDLFRDLPVEVEIRNQSRVHLWYPAKFGKDIEPFRSTEEAISMWPTFASSVGVTISHGLKVYAPFGLHDLFGMVARPNKVLVTKSAYETKVKRWNAAWPGMRVEQW